MILPSDDDPRARRDDEPEPPSPFEQGAGDIPPWMGAQSDDSEEEDEDVEEEFEDLGEFEDDDEEEVEGPFEGAQFSELDIQAPAAPGWRAELRDELVSAINDLREIEDPDQDFDPPDPPDLYTFYGELAALRHEFRRSSRRAAEGIENSGETLRRLTHGVNDIVRAMGQNAESGPSAGPREVLEQSVIDLHDQVSAVLASRSRSLDREGLAASLDALLAATGISRLPVETGDPVDADKMKVVAREKAHGKKNTVLRVERPGFVSGDRLLRPAHVVVIGRP